MHWTLQRVTARKEADALRDMPTVQRLGLGTGDARAVASIAGREGVVPLHRSSTMIAHTRRARAGSGAGRHVPRIPLSLWRHSRIKAVMDA